MDRDIIDILNFSRAQLIGFLRFSAGLSNPNFGGIAKGIVGGKYNLRLQQHPEEYSRLLMFLKEVNSKSYLELGVGQGGSFFMNSLFQENLIKCYAVDDCDYQRNAAGFGDQSISITEKVNELKQIKNNDDIKFFNQKSSDFFKNNSNMYDIIFIDADHRYEGAKSDYESSIKILNKDGFIIFHDIINYDPEIGIPKLWGELDDNKKIHEFIDSGFAGIGVYKP